MTIWWSSTSRTRSVGRGPGAWASSTASSGAGGSAAPDMTTLLTRRQGGGGPEGRASVTSSHAREADGQATRPRGDGGAHPAAGDAGDRRGQRLGEDDA